MHVLNIKALLLATAGSVAGAAAIPHAAFAQAAAAPAPAIPTVETIAGIGPVGEWRKLGGGYSLSEGPSQTPDGAVYFTDFRGGEIHRVDPVTSDVSVFLSDINAGGLAVDRAGKLIVAEGRAGKILRIDPATKAVSVIAERIDGARFNAPNDLLIDGKGGIYFSDPSQGAPLPLPQGKQSIYYVDAQGKTTRLVDYLPRPNGLALSKDGRSLYVALSGDSEILGYRVLAPGKLSPDSAIFARTAYQPSSKRGESAITGVDGLAADELGNVYAAGRFGIEVFDPAGRSLGMIATPERPSNMKFGGADGHTLYVTTYTSIYAVKMAVGGSSWPK